MLYSALSKRILHLSKPKNNDSVSQSKKPATLRYNVSVLTDIELELLQALEARPAAVWGHYCATLAQYLIARQVG